MACVDGCETIITKSFIFSAGNIGVPTYTSLFDADGTCSDIGGPCEEIEAPHGKFRLRGKVFKNNPRPYTIFTAAYPTGNGTGLGSDFVSTRHLAANLTADEIVDEIIDVATCDRWGLGLLLIGDQISTGVIGIGTILSGGETWTYYMTFLWHLIRTTPCV